MYCKKFLDDFTDKVIEKTKSEEVYLVFELNVPEHYDSEYIPCLKYMFNNLEDAHLFLNSTVEMELTCEISFIRHYVFDLLLLGDDTGEGWLLDHPALEMKYFIYKQQMTKSNKK